MFFFFNDTATTEIYTLSLHDALPIWWADITRISCKMPRSSSSRAACCMISMSLLEIMQQAARELEERSEEHTSELQSQSNLVCRLLLEKNNTINSIFPILCTTYLFML